MNSEINRELVIDNLLCFITSSINNLDNETIMYRCSFYYNVDIIKNSKELLCSYLGVEPKIRRGDYARRAHINDIIKLISDENAHKVTLPKFVADTYNGMSYTSSNDLMGAVLSALSDELLSIRSDLNEMKGFNKVNSILVDDNTTIKSEIMDIKNNIRDLKLKFYDREIRRKSENDCLSSVLCFATPAAAVASPAFFENLASKSHTVPDINSFSPSLNRTVVSKSLTVPELSVNTYKVSTKEPCNNVPETLTEKNNNFVPDTFNLLKCDNVPNSYNGNNNATLPGCSSGLNSQVNSSIYTFIEDMKKSDNIPSAPSLSQISSNDEVNCVSPACYSDAVKSMNSKSTDVAMNYIPKKGKVAIIEVLNTNSQD